MPTNSYDKIIGQSGQSSDDPIQNAFNNYSTYYGEGNTGLQDTIFGNWFNPGISQDKEFAQQVSLQQMQNDWSVAGKMQAMKDAGINANVAAAGIAGASSPSASSPNSAVGAGAQGVASAAQAAGAVNDAVNAGVNAYEKISLTSVERDKRKAEIREKLSAALHNDWLAYSISELLPDQKSNTRADTYLKLANFAKAREEKKLINKRIDEAQKHIDEMDSQISLYEKQGNYTDALKLRTDKETAQIQLQNDKLQWDKDWRTLYKYDPNSPIDVALEQAMVNGAEQDVIDAIGTATINAQYWSEAGSMQAAVESAFDLENNKKRGQLDSLGEEIATRLEGRRKELEQNTEFQKELAKIDVSKDSANKVISLFLKYLFGVGFNVNVGKVGVNNTQPSGL